MIACILYAGDKVQEERRKMMANFELDNDYDGVEVTIKVIGVGGGG